MFQQSLDMRMEIAPYNECLSNFQGYLFLAKIFTLFSAVWNVVRCYPNLGSI